MDKLIVGTVALLVVGLMLILACIIGTAFGALAGLIVAFFFPNTTAAVLAALGIKLALWQVGAALGFVSMFVKSSVTQNNQS